MNSRIKLITLLLIFSSISIEATTPKAAKSKYFMTESAGFVMEQDEGVMYLIKLSVRKKIRKVMYGTAFFDNPMDEQSPSVINFELMKGDKDLTFRSPIIREITNAKSYEVKILLYKDIDKTELKNTHTQMVEFLLPSEIAAEKGIKLISSKIDKLNPNKVKINGWSLALDKLNWQEASKRINIEEFLIEFIPSGEVLDHWSTLIASHIIYTNIETDWVYNYMIKELKKDCPSFTNKVYKQSSDSILFEWSHAGCRGNPAQFEIRKIVNSYNFSYSLAISWNKEMLPEKRKELWISKFESAKAEF